MPGKDAGGSSAPGRAPRGRGGRRPRRSDRGPVTVTARAGTVSLPAAFTFEEAGSAVTMPNVSPLVIADLATVIPDLSSPDETECHVPRLKGKALKQVKSALAAAHCKLGKVTKRKGVKANRARVIGELPPPGSRAPANASVRVRLG